MRNSWTSAHPADYLSTSLTLLARDAAERGLPVPGAQLGARSAVHPSARVENSILWDDVEVGEGTMLRECVVTDGAHVPADTSWIGVTIRRAEGDLAPQERRVGDLAIASL